MNAHNSTVPLHNVFVVYMYMYIYIYMYMYMYMYMFLQNCVHEHITYNPCTLYIHCRAIRGMYTVHVLVPPEADGRVREYSNAGYSSMGS